MVVFWLPRKLLNRIRLVPSVTARLVTALLRSLGLEA